MYCTISCDIKMPLVILRTTLTAQKNVEDVLLTVALHFMACHPGAILQQENPRLHTTCILLDCVHFADADFVQKRYQSVHHLNIYGRW